MDRDTIIRVIRELANKTVDNGCTEAEAMSAAKKIDQLLTAYNLTLDKVFIEESNCVQDSVSTGKRQAHPITYACQTIASFCDCKVWIRRGKAGLDYCFFGTPTDVMMAKHMYSLVLRAIDNETIKFKLEQYRLYHACSKTTSNSFQKGMAIRVSKRLMDMIQQRQHQYVSGCTSLVVLKNQKRDEEFKGLGMKLRGGTSNWSNLDDNAYTSGYKAGDNVPLNKPITDKPILCLN
jgi:sulfur transfer protein SufE